MESLGSPPQPVKKAPLIALTTDFGLHDPYVGIMKAVILSLCPGVQLVDLCHGIPPQDVRAGSLALESARRFFPVGTVHVAVIDPGVGSARRALVVGTDRDRFVVPDNGLVSFLADREIREVREIRHPDCMLKSRSATFDGRDLFAPTAARLAAGFPLRRVGPVVEQIQRLSPPHLVVGEDGVEGEILAFDHFGSAVTSITDEDLPAAAQRIICAATSLPLVRTYADVQPGQPLALVGSSGHLELAVRNASARQRLNLQLGQRVRVTVLQGA